MSGEAAYLDTAFLFRLYWEDPGFEKIEAFAASRSHLTCALQGRAELLSCAHRKYREGYITKKDLQILLDQLQIDVDAGAIDWLPLTPAILNRIEKIYRRAPANSYLRAADAIHLATAADYGVDSIYSNDRHLLKAASLFGLNGRNLLDE